ncbi:capsular polysaccharide synthesis protein-domain-containing protein [Podospora didyma]|uniref:Capsular polysaccharide synthesis protein-domain-containing protein n=1 Tax=Podospora didyma TaxID=330526 RepID=A0AAE0NP65_9PEZI|nr:capsular polysaccharide synthesis protein-domain-containing protein [Podospora didyma]
MTRPSFDLPAGTGVLPSSTEDTRTNDDITAALANPPSEVTSQKNIWAFWDKGFDELRGWQKRNVIGWARKLGPSWTVRVLDCAPGSPSNVLNYLDPATLPEAVVNCSMTEAHSGQHLSDLVRLPLLHRYGGIYLDIGVFLLGDLEGSLWNKIVDPASDYRIGGFAHQHRKNSWGSLQNFCIVAQRGEEALQVWQRILLEVWKGRTSSQGLVEHPVFDGVPAEINPRVLMTIKPGSEADLMDYWVNLLGWEKLKVTVDAARGFNGPEYVRKHALLLDPMQESFAAEVRTRLNTFRLFQMLTCPRDAHAPGVDPALHAEAKALVDYLLTSSTVLKLYHGHGHMLAPPLATFWDAPGNEDADARPGTFGEYLRYVGETVDQKREVQPLVLPAYDGPVLYKPLP